MAKRGIKAEAIRNYWIDVGMKEVDIEFSWDNLYAFNKQIIDPVADRYFFVWDPQPVDIVGVDRLTSRSPLHPDHPERGTRDHELTVPIRVYMNREDLEGFRERGTVRLKDLCNLRWEDGRGVYTGNDHSVLREGVKIAHWAPVDGVEAEVVMSLAAFQKMNEQQPSDMIAGVVKQLSNPNNDIFYGAPAIVFIFTTPNCLTPVEDASLAAENMMLAAKSLGLGSCWIGFARALGQDPECLKELNVPADHQLVASIVLGYPRKGDMRPSVRDEPKVLGWLK